MKPQPKPGTCALIVAAGLLFPIPALAADDAVRLGVPLAFFASIVGVVGLLVYGYRQEVLQRHQTVRAMIDKGIEVPRDLLRPLRPSPGVAGDVRRGVLLIAAGLGIALFLAVEEGPKEATLGLIPAFVGLGYLLLARLAKNHRPEMGESPSPAGAA